MSEPVKSISLVIPVYNEEKLIETALNYCYETLKKDFEEFEIILIDDGSKDKSYLVLEEFCKGRPEIKVIQNNINLNQGISVQRGYSIASKKYIIHNGIDLPLNPSKLKELIEDIGETEVLILERKAYQGAIMWRKITSKVNICIRRILFPILSKGIHDMNYTQIYKREILHKVMPIAKSPAFTTPEMIFRARNANLKIRTITLEFEARPFGKGSLGKLHDILWTFYDMLRFRCILWKGLN